MAGSWYPGRGEELREIVAAFLGLVPEGVVPGRLVGLLSPHAGLRYSGAVAAHAYALLRGFEGTVVLVGPSHREAFPGVALFSHGLFETPLGRIPVDEDLSAALLSADPGIQDRPGPHRLEHSLEMQLPFLQALSPRIRIVAALMGRQSREEVERLSAALSSVLGGRGAVLLASSDLSHYHPAPAAHRLDDLVRGDVERFDPDSLQERLERSDEHACGGGPLVAVMRACRALGASRSQVLRYADSGDFGERVKGRVVGYLAAAFLA